MKKIFWLIIALFPSVIYADTGVFWLCISRDASSKEWQATSEYQLSAVNKSFEACKKNSTVPETCKTSKADCDHRVNGLTTRPLWRCTAYDQMAKAWRSNLYTNMDDAAIAAKAFCQEHSGFPDTCYINLMTCKNLNPQEQI